MSEYLKDEQFIKEMKEVERIARSTPRPKRMMVSESEYEELKESGSDMERFYRRRDVEHISKIIPRVMGKIKHEDSVPF